MNARRNVIKRWGRLLVQPKESVAAQDRRALMLNFIKHNRKLLNAGTMKEERVKPFIQLLALIVENKRKNQWK
jgi:hypothetical protein